MTFNKSKLIGITFKSKIGGNVLQNIAKIIINYVTYCDNLNVLSLWCGGHSAWILSKDVSLAVQYKVYLVKRVISLVDTVYYS